MFKLDLYLSLPVNLSKVIWSPLKGGHLKWNFAHTQFVFLILPCLCSAQSEQLSGRRLAEIPKKNQVFVTLSWVSERLRNLIKIRFSFLSVTVVAKCYNLSGAPFSTCLLVSLRIVFKYVKGFIVSLRLTEVTKFEMVKLLLFVAISSATVFAAYDDLPKPADPYEPPGYEPEVSFCRHIGQLIF